jgi:hypothetical protein
MRHFWLAVSIWGVIIGLGTPLHASLSDDEDELVNSCSLLYVHVTNGTPQRAVLANNSDQDRIHGYFVQHGGNTVAAGETVLWKMDQHPLSGPEGKLVYSWRDFNNELHNCEISYNQSFCFLRAGKNTTKVSGSCFVHNEPTKPSKVWSSPGVSWVTLQASIPPHNS